MSDDAPAPRVLTRSTSALETVLADVARACNAASAIVVLGDGPGPRLAAVHGVAVPAEWTKTLAGPGTLLDFDFDRHSLPIEVLTRPGSAIATGFRHTLRDDAAVVGTLNVLYASEQPLTPEIATALTLGAHAVLAETRAARASRLLEIMESRFSRVFAHWVAGLYETTLEGQYITANPALAHLFGYESAAEMMSAIVDVENGCYVRRGRRAEFVALIERDGTVTNFESEVYRKDRTIFWMSEDAIAVRDAAGRVVGFQGTIIDITERKLADQSLRRREAALRASQTELRRTDALRREFVAGISHDLRTPLTALRGYVETLVLKPDLLRTAEGVRYLHAAARQVRAVERLVSDLFDLATLESADAALRPERFDVTELADGVLRDFSVTAAPQGVTLSTNFTGRARVRGDIALIERALRNLLENAVRHTPPGGTVTLSCVGSPPFATIQVLNSGALIPEHEIPRLFDPYHRGQPDPSDRQRRVGLGLAIANRILLLHESTLVVQNFPDRGVAFTFVLPLA